MIFGRAELGRCYNSLLIALLVFFITNLTSSFSYAEIFKCTDKDGKKSFQSTPCVGVNKSEAVEIYVPDYDPVKALKAHEEHSQRVRLLEEKEHQRRLHSLMLEKKIAIGMSQEQVERAWGRPYDIDRTITSRGTTEHWFYQKGRESVLVSFDGVPPRVDYISD